MKSTLLENGVDVAEHVDAFGYAEDLYRYDFLHRPL